MTVTIRTARAWKRRLHLDRGLHPDLRGGGGYWLLYHIAVRKERRRVPRSPTMRAIGIRWRTGAAGWGLQNGIIPLAHIPELLAAVHARKCIFRHHLLGGGAPRAEGSWPDFDLRTGNQATLTSPRGSRRTVI